MSAKVRAAEDRLDTAAAFAGGIFWALIATAIGFGNWALAIGTTFWLVVRATQYWLALREEASA